MKQILLALFLIAAPVGIFAAVHIVTAPSAATAPSLGDLSPFKTIIDDVRAIAKTGDFKAAGQRVTDFETAWDDAEAHLHPTNPEAWGVIDGAADAAFRALRTAKPDAADVDAKLVALGAALDNPVAATGGGGVAYVGSVAVSDANGHAIPCEDMLKALRSALAAGSIAPAGAAQATDFLAKATERCNADDDAHADQFSAKGLTLAKP